MTTLLERSRQSRTGLDRARLANLLRQQVAAMQARAAEWSGRSARRDAVQAQWRVLQARLGSLPDVESTNAAAKALAGQARKVLEGATDVQALSADNLWARLLNGADAAIAAASEAVKSAWREHIAELGTVEAPAVLESRVLRTPATRDPLEQYKLFHSQYLRIVRQDAPSDPAVLTQLSACVRQLRDIQATLIIDAPESVRNFFKSIEEGGATIDQLTPDVLDWLRAHDDIRRFVVKPKSVVAWG
ncbi:MAG: hypothetical protein Q8L49_09430 [Burkholderiaceae bacterium]|nr:hypothetical protein [Burkholderiaceae bacterium]